MIPEETIEQIRLSTDIAQIIGEYIRLKKRGKNFISVCPFHTEKTPSFSVSIEKQIFHCFGCGKGGNVYTFLMEHEKMSFIESVKHLASKANIAIKEDARDDYRRQQLDRILYANQIALDYYEAVLRQSKYKRVLDDYLKDKRQIDEASIKHFHLGLAGDDWEGLIKYAGKKDLSPEYLDRGGLAILSEKKKSYFDRFRMRLMVPIFNLSQKPIAFGGRTLKKGEPAKYINSPETSLYVKGNVLYNLNFAKDHIRKEGFVYIVEGYFDVISLWQVGIKNVVASSGTAFTAQQARLLARFTEEVYLFFDADSAGRNAALRSVDSLYDAGLEVKVIRSQQGEDPDTLARKFGADKIETLKSDAIGYIAYRVEDININATGIIGREKLIKEFASLSSKINDPTRRALFLEQAAQTMQVSPELFSVTVQRQSSPSPSPVTRRKYSQAEIEFVSLLSNNPGTIDTIIEKISPEDFDSKELSRLYSAMIDQYRSLGEININRIIDNVNDHDFISLISEVSSIEWPADSIDHQTVEHVQLIYEAKKKRIRKQLNEQLAIAEKEGDQEKADSILQELKGYGL